MQKTSVYLPEVLKSRLARFAAEAGRSEAEVIRDALEDMLRNGAEPRHDDSDPAVPGRLVGVGIGPGPADLVTVRAVHALRRADRVVAPCVSIDTVGRAEAIVRGAVPKLPVERVVFVMQPDHDARLGALNDVCDRLADWLEAGEELAFVTLGDPNTYSTFSSVAAGVLARRPSTVVETVPGVMAFQDLAGRAGVVVADEQQSIHVVPAVACGHTLDALLDDDSATIVIYKGGAHLPEVAERLARAGRLDGAVFGELLGMPGERIAEVVDVADRPASYLSSVIVPARTGAGPVPKRSERVAT